MPASSPVPFPAAPPGGVACELSAPQPLRWRPDFEATRPWLALPFDALRHQYAGAVVAGLAPRSMLASGRVERFLDALESLTLGPFARQR